MFNNIPHIFVQDNTSDAELIKRVKIVGNVSVIAVSIVAGEIILKSIKELPFIKRAIIFTEPSPHKVKPLMEKFKEHGIETISFDDLMELGRRNPTQLVHPSTDDVAMILFTSGKLTDT